MRENGYDSIEFDGNKINDGTKALYRKATEELAQANSTTPDALLTEIKGDPAKLEAAYVRWLEAHGTRSYASIVRSSAGIKFWLRFNGHIDPMFGKIPFWVKCKAALETRFDKDDLPKIRCEKRHPLTRRDLQTAFMRADRRAKALLTILASSAARINAARMLNWSDFEDLTAEKEAYQVTLIKKQTPGVTEDTYRGFISREARDCLLAWQEEQKTAGFYRPDGPVFTSQGRSWDKRGKGERLTPVGLNRVFRSAVHCVTSKDRFEKVDESGRLTTRHNLSPHVLRRWARDMMGDAGLDSVVCKKLLGQKPLARDMDSRYWRKLDDPEFLRQKYLEAIDFLTISEEDPRRTKDKDAIIRALRQEIADLKAAQKGNELERARFEEMVSTLTNRVTQIEQRRKPEKS